MHFADGGERGCKNTSPLSSNAFGDGGDAARGQRGARPAGGGGDDPAPPPLLPPPSLALPCRRRASSSLLVLARALVPAPPRGSAPFPRPAACRRSSSLLPPPTPHVLRGHRREERRRPELEVGRRGGEPVSCAAGSLLAPALPPRAATAAERRSCSLEPARRHRRSRGRPSASDAVPRGPPSWPPRGRGKGPPHATPPLQGQRPRVPGGRGGREL